MALPRHTCVVPLALACLPVHGCTQLSEGAVEVSWSLYDDTGAAMNCAKANIETISLYWQGEVVLDDGGIHSQTRSREFPCKDYHGVTRFDFEPGEASLWLAPQCIPPAMIDSRTFDAPPPIVRTITAGEVVTLDTQILQLRTSGSCDASDPCICTP